jgi:hypothetical protein
LLISFKSNSCQSSTKFSEEGGTSIVNHLHQQPRVTWSVLTTKVNVKNTFLKRHLYLRNSLLDQGYKKIRLIRSLKKFIFRYQYLVEIYSVSAEKIISDAFSFLILYLYTFSLYENASLIIFSAETEYISTRYWYRNINFLRDRIRRIFL